MNDNGHKRNHVGIQKVSLEQVLKLIEQLSSEERVELAQRLIGGSGLTVVLGGNNVINNSFAVQLNGNSEQLEEQLQQIPPDVIALLLEAIARRIACGTDSQKSQL